MAKKLIYYRDWDELPVMLTLEQAALICAKTPDCLRKWASAGKIPASKLPDGSLLFDKEKIKEWLQKRSNATVQQCAAS